VPLSSMTPGEEGIVSRVPDGDPALLQYLRQLSLIPGARIAVESVAPFGHVVTVRVDGGTEAVGGEVAQQVRVKPAPEVPA
jgi:Fe2+ transport system protein FeoA